MHYLQVVKESHVAESTLLQIHSTNGLLVSRYKVEKFARESNQKFCCNQYFRLGYE